MKALVQSGVAEEPGNLPGAVCPAGGKCPPNARCPIESECPLSAEETARWVEEVEANRAKLKAIGGLSDAEVAKLAVEYGLTSAGTTMPTPELRQMVEGIWCLPTVEYPPEEMARLDRIAEEAHAQWLVGELKPIDLAEFAAAHGLEFHG